MAPKTKAEVMSNLGMECFKKGDTKKGADYFEQALKLVEGEPTNPLLVTLLTNLGVAQTILGDMSASLGYLERALEMQEKDLGEMHPDLVGTLQNLTVVCSKLGETEKAVNYMTRAGEIESKAKVDSKVQELEAGSADQVSGPKITEVEE
eukprot:CAMPEP_0115439332 /NCGR_PEP_ID=MMETSP0271-20121206/35721_1 /TAXON_ID=71861 /ORGANISM="Scrippsiella trochoidea, Strain CCMP3099" /LENGTH=149 /DNA_ID=CAMNT_0002865019 /DNA_START=95 /DNA_END=544 /DNA_ORIENTATION=-